MDAIQKVDLEVRTDIRQAWTASELAWGAYSRVANDPHPVKEAAEADLGYGADNATKKHNLQARNAYAEFEVKPDTGEVLLKIIDAESGKVVRTVPPDELKQCITDGQDWTRLWRIYI